MRAFPEHSSPPIIRIILFFPSAEGSAWFIALPMVCPWLSLSSLDLYRFSRDKEEASCWKEASLGAGGGQILFKERLR